MKLETYCPDSFGPLNKAMDGKMGFIMSSWDNRDARTDSIETYNKCPQMAASCDSAMATFSEVKFKQWGYNEAEKIPNPNDPDDPNNWTDPHPEPDNIPDPVDPDENEDNDDNTDDTDPPQPLPVPAVWKKFTGYSEMKDGLFEFSIKGLDDRFLDTTYTGIEIGIENRGFINDYPNEVDTYWTYKDNYLGGSLEFDVDVSNVPCACYAHVYLTPIS